VTADLSTATARLSALARESLALPGAEQLTDAQIAATSFMRLGGDSLRALSLVGNAAERLGVRLRVADLLADTPLGEVLGMAAAAPPAAVGPVPEPGPLPEPQHVEPPSLREPLSGETKHTLPVSSMQEGLWLGNQILGGAPYCLVFYCHVTGDLRPDLLAQAIRLTGGRHDGLRTVFPVSRGQVSRLVTDCELTLEQVPCPAEACGSQAAWKDFTTGVAERLCREPFDLGKYPPIRLALASSGSGRHCLVLAVHHILLDGWSIALTLREIFARYDALAAGEDHLSDDHLGPAIQTGAYDAWQRQMRASGALSGQLAFWQRQLDGVPELLELPSNKPRQPLRDAAGARLPVDLGPQLTDRVHAAASSAGITTTAFMLAALGLTTARYTGAERLVIGMPVAGRPPELSELVGITVNLLPVRIDIPQAGSVRDYLGAVQRSLSVSLDNGAVPFAEIAQALGVPSSARQHPLAQVAFGMHHNVLPATIGSRFVEIRLEEGHGGGSQFDLELLIGRDKPALSGCLEYSTGIWDERDAEGFLAGLTAGITALADAPDAELSSIRCIAAAGRAQLAALAAHHDQTSPGSLDDWFRAQVARTPDAPAVRDGAIELSYAELDRAAAVQADLLRQAGVTTGGRVLIACPRSAAEVVAVLGVIRSGAAYCGLDRDAPAERVGQMLATLCPGAVIGEGAGTGEGTAAVHSVPAWHPGWQAGQTQDGAGLGPADPDGPARLAYITFTSGSTGGPKGVCIQHRGVQRLVAGLERYAPVGSGDRVLRMSPLSFDASTFEIWGALLTGAALEIGPDDVTGPHELGQFVSGRQVTVAFFTSGLFRLVVEFAASWLGGLRVLLTGGDVVSAAHVRAALDRCPGLTVINCYGPAENSAFTTVHPMTSSGEADDPVPIGRPIAGTGICILDSYNRMVPPGAIGELCTSGAGLAAGYLDDPERTAAAFGEFCPDLRERLYRTGDLVRLDAAGRVRFLGRRDHQVKVRGFRIELDEIRSAVMSSPAVSLLDCFVMAAGQDSASKQLVAAVVPAADEAQPDLAGLVKDLAARLPAYMVPRMWAVLSELPLTRNGKTDRAVIARQAVTLAGPAGPVDVHSGLTTVDLPQRTNRGETSRLSRRPIIG
jgi:amino acid adenylation domain-containing protein